MKHIKLTISILLSASIMMSCVTTKQLQSIKEQASDSFQKQDYAKAYELYNDLITKLKSKKTVIPNEFYERISESAKNTGNFADGAKWYSEAINTNLTVSNIKGYIDCLKGSDNFKKVDETINKYSSFLTKNGEENYLNKELFNSALRKKDTEKTIALYSKIKNPTKVETIAYFYILINNNKTQYALKLCDKLNKKNNIPLELQNWEGEYYYNEANKKYKTLMSDYNKNKTYTNYLYLKRDLKPVSANFRKARAIFEKLHSSIPNDKKYIKYLFNIYTRLDLKDRANSMKKLLEK